MCFNNLNLHVQAPYGIGAKKHESVQELSVTLCTMNHFSVRTEKVNRVLGQVREHRPPRKACVNIGHHPALAVRTATAGRPVRTGGEQYSEWKHVQFSRSANERQARTHGWRILTILAQLQAEQQHD